MDLISVIIPVYNVEQMLDRCITSVVNQTYKHLQIILVNDGSTDGSLEICEYWAKKDDRICVLSKRNEGTASARNYGLNAAKGNWIAFVDSDDYIEKDFLNTLLDCAYEYEADVAACKIMSKSRDGVEFDPFNNEYTFKSIYYSHEFLRLLYDNDKSNGYVVSVWNKIYKVDLWNNNLEQLRFQENCFYEDDEVSARLYCKDLKIGITNKTKYFYIQNPNSKTNSKYSVNKWIGLKSFYDRILVFKPLDVYLYKEAIKMFLNLYIEHYYMAIELDDDIKFYEMNKMFNNAFYMYTEAFHFSKATARLALFKLSPKLYRKVCM